MKTYPTKEWTDKECALALLEAIINLGQHAADGLVVLAVKMKDRAAIMHDLEEAFRRQRKKEMPDCIREGLARAVEGAIRAEARDAAVANRNLN